MSDTGSIIPTLTQLISGSTLKTTGIVLTLLKTPESLTQVNQPRTLAGTIIEHKQNNQINIKTNAGLIVAQSQQKLSLPIGQNIKLTLDQSTTPQQAIIEKSSIPLSNTRGDATTTQIQSNAPLPALTASQLTQVGVIKTTPTTAQQLQNAITVPIDKSDIKVNFTTEKPITVKQMTTNQIQLNQNNLSVAKPPLQNTIPQTNVTPPAAAGSNTQSVTSPAPPSLSTTVNIHVKTVEQGLVPKLQSLPIITNSNQTATKPQITGIQITQTIPPSPNIATSINTTHPTLQATHAQHSSAELTGFTKEQSLPILRLQNAGQEQNLTLHTPVKNIPIGTKFIVGNIQTSPPPANAAASTAQPHSALFLTAETKWPVLSDIAQTLSQNGSNAQLAHNFTATLPSPAQPTQINAASLFFIAAMRAGDVQGWVGDKAIEALKNSGKSDLINALKTEMSSINTLNREPITQDWRSLALPMTWQDEIQKIILHYRHEQDETEHNAGQGKQTRFIMDLNLSQLGDIQIDGLFADHTNSKKLDLIIRSEDYFSKAMQMQMQNLYTQTMEASQIAGHLSFQKKSDNWVNIKANIEAQFTDDI